MDCLPTTRHKPSHCVCLKATPRVFCDSQAFFPAVSFGPVLRSKHVYEYLLDIICLDFMDSVVSIACPDWTFGRSIPSVCFTQSFSMDTCHRCGELYSRTSVSASVLPPGLGLYTIPVPYGARTVPRWARTESLGLQPSPTVGTSGDSSFAREGQELASLGLLSRYFPGVSSWTAYTHATQALALFA